MKGMIKNIVNIDRHVSKQSHCIIKAFFDKITYNFFIHVILLY